MPEYLLLENGDYWLLENGELWELESYSDIAHLVVTDGPAQMGTGGFMTEVYDVGDLVRVSAYFTIHGVAADPTNPTCKYKDPSDIVITKEYPTDPEVVKDQTGMYYMDISIDDSGTWYYRWSGTGAAQAAQESSFDVAITEFP